MAFAPAPGNDDRSLTLTDVGPGLQVDLHKPSAHDKDKSAQLYLRAERFDADAEGPHVVRMAINLPAERVRVTGSATEGAGPFTVEALRLVARTETDPAYRRGEPFLPGGTLTIEGNGPGTATRSTAASPIGPLEAEILPATKTDSAPDPFEPGARPPLTFHATWQAGKTLRMQTRFIEIRTRLTGLGLALPDADYSDLRFQPTDLTLLYSEQPPDSSLESLILLGETGGQPRARIDLARASLKARRVAGNLGLAFRFSDIYLICDGKETELVALNDRCFAPVVSGASHQTRADTHPILVVEFPPQHLMETALSQRTDPIPPDVELPKQKAYLCLRSGEVFDDAAEGRKPIDLNSRTEIVRALNCLPGQAQRIVFRKAIHERKIIAEKAAVPQTSAFKTFAEKLRWALSRRSDRLNSKPYPKDERTYIGPFAMSADVMAVARRLARTLAEAAVQETAKAALKEVTSRAEELLNKQDRTALSRDQLFELDSAIERMLEASVPFYADFRAWYREDAVSEISSGHAAPSTFVTEVSWWAVTGFLPPWSGQTNIPSWGAMWKKAQSKWIAFLEFVAHPEAEGGLMRGHLSKPSRLAYRIGCRDGVLAARLAVPGLETDSTLLALPADPSPERLANLDRPGLRRKTFAFTLEALTRFGDMELSVINRARVAYTPDEAGRVDRASRRQVNLNNGAMLDLLGFHDPADPGPYTSTQWLTKVRAILKEPSDFETAIELPTRLILSPSQNGVFQGETAVPDDVYSTRPGQAWGPRPQRLWSARLYTGDDTHGLRAVASPDFNPDFLLRYLGRLEGQVKEAQGKDPLFDIGAPPPAGSFAPWFLPRGPVPTEFTSPVTAAKELGDEEAKALAEGKDDAAFCKALLETGPEPERRKRFSALFAVLCDRLNKQPVSEDVKRFVTGLDARQRFEIVLMSSVWGLPVEGRRDTNMLLAADSSQAEPDPRDMLLDLRAGSAFYVPRTLNVVYLMLSTLGGSLLHTTQFQPIVGAMNLKGVRVTESTNLEKYHHWIEIGRDVETVTLSRGYLFPTGHLCSYVQSTERVFLEDRTAGAFGPWPIRAYTNKRRFISVEHGEKKFGAPGQPLNGRTFPVRLAAIITTVTPDLVDPTEGQKGEAFSVTANGRIDGLGGDGMAFWPRMMPTSAGTLRFKQSLDGVQTDLPLIYVDNILASDAGALSKLADYYRKQDDDTRRMQLNSRKMRYADERESGSASLETESWVLSVCGREAGPPQINTTDNTVTFSHENYQSTPVLLGANQPPFYPVLQKARVHLRQLERITGKALDPFDAMLDGRYLQTGLPPLGKDDKPESRGAEIFLDLLGAGQQGVGDSGDRVGGMVRPQGYPLGLSRSRGLIFWKEKLPNEVPAGTFPAWSRLLEDQPANQPAPPPTGEPGKVTRHREALSGAFGDTKLMGVIKISDLINVLSSLPSVGQAANQMSEFLRYGMAEGDKGAKQTVADLRNGLVRPLLQAVVDIRATWAAVDAKLKARQSALAGQSVVANVTLADIFPELDAGLTDLETALRRGMQETEAIAFAMSMGVVYEAGRRFLDAIQRVLSDPVERFSLALQTQLDEIGAFFKSVAETLVQGLFIQLREAVQDLITALPGWLAKKIVPADLVLAVSIPADWGLTGTQKEALNKALEPLTLIASDLRPYAVAFFAHVLANSEGTPEDLVQTFLDSKAPQGLEGSGPLVSDRLTTSLQRRLKDAEANLGLLLDAEVKDIAGILVAEIKALQDFSPSALRRVVTDQRLPRWRMVSRVADAAKRLQTAFTAGDVRGALIAAADLSALFGGPGVDRLTALCNAALSPVLQTLDVGDLKLFADLPFKITANGSLDSKLVPAPKPGTESLHLALAELHDAMLDAKPAIEKLESDANRLSQSEKDAIKDALKALGDIKDPIDAVKQSARQLFTTLCTERLAAQALQKRLSDAIDAAGTLCTTPGDVGSLRSLSTDIDLYLVQRKEMLTRSETSLIGLSSAVETLANSPLVQAALGVGGLAALLKPIAGKWPKRALFDQVDKFANYLPRSTLSIADPLLRDGLAVTQKIEKALEDIKKLKGDWVKVETLDAAINDVSTLKNKLERAANQSKALLDDSTAKVTLDAVRKLMVEFNPSGATLKLDFSPILSRLKEVQDKVDDALATLRDEIIRSLTQAVLKSTEELAAVITKVLQAKVSFAGKQAMTLASVYKTIQAARQEIIDQAEKNGLALLGKEALTIAPDPIRQALAKELELPEEADQLDIDTEALRQLPPPDAAGLDKFSEFLPVFLREWAGEGRSSPLYLFDRLDTALRSLLRGEVLQLIDLAEVRAMIEQHIKALLPVEVVLKHGTSLELPDTEVATATGGLLVPVGSPRLDVYGEVRVSLLDNKPMRFRAGGTLGAFNIVLVGNAFTALTLQFGGAKFSAGSGQNTTFDLQYLGHEIGPMMQFLKPLQDIMNPSEGSGAYVDIQLSPPRLEAGYRLNIGEFSMGVVAFANVALSCSVLLPFGDGDATFRVALSTRESPFTVSYLPWGGSGFFAVEAAADGIRSMELQLEFGGAAIFKFGPLVGKGRAMAGLYVRTFEDKTLNKKLTEITATFYLGGDAKIWVFSFGASLMVRMGQIDGRMKGEAIFNFSFSMGFADFRYSVRMKKSEEEGYSESSSNGEVSGGGGGGGPGRKASLGRAVDLALRHLVAGGDSAPVHKAHIVTGTVCQGQDWKTYDSYFTREKVVTDGF
ncbi:hypothetical protein NX862_05065 [Rhodobacter sp. KR11]|uniref:hypothetical protein n=1 Tax=Rhodobacter sp. KR11 TaxID=2974588 RepID=UPI0022212CAD|nr:hypothetical protein [Rhodobacter sp. KR11]MCW1918117.1 hypothetical protein [Rhodobacter sp. KR11]